MKEDNEGHIFDFNGQTYEPHTSLHRNHTAFFRSSWAQIIVVAILIYILVIDLLLWPKATIITLIAILTGLYFTDLVFNLFLITRSFIKDRDTKIEKAEISRIPDAQWPTYTILCPLYKEASVLPQFIEAMSKMDYPKNKLQIMLLLEDDDPETMNTIQEAELPSYFEVVRIPHSMPKTKPKALNYGLKLARGKYSVIFDAEDNPDTDQLKKAVLAFGKLGSKTACVQAKLNFYNPRQNLLTRIFTAEYSTWFDMILTGLQSINAPIPLGGTSNHFPTVLLRKFKGWDPFNVTEDCDLGIRLVKHGYQTAIMDSTTWEEANSSPTNWFSQRTRWIKGYIQTYFVHMRYPHHFFNKAWRPHLFTFQLVVGGKIMSMFINPMMWLITISYFAFRPVVQPIVETYYLAPVLYMGTFSLVVGNFMYMYYYMIGCAKRGQDDLIKYAFLVPFYWLGMSAAAWVSVWQFIRRPHHWSKTVHGLHLKQLGLLYEK